jgi:hypothetical protein
MERRLDLHNDYTVKKAVYNGEYYKYFNIHEFDAKSHSYEFVTTDVYRASINMIVDMFKVGEMQVDFRDDATNEKFLEIWNTRQLYKAVEKFIEKAKVYGPSYIELAEDIYTPSPANIEAIYNEFNPEATEKGYIKTIHAEIEKTRYTLEIAYYDGEILYNAFINYGQKNQKQVPMPLMFMDLIPEEATQVDMGYELNTNLTYNTMQGVQYNVKDDEFYGCGDLTLPILSKLNYYNRLVNLCDVIFTYNAFPKFQGSEEVMKLMKNAKDEIANYESQKDITLPTTFMNEAPRANFLDSASHLFTLAFKRMREKLYIFPAGRGENKYIINEYNMTYLFEERDRIKKEILDEMNISGVLYDSELKTGQLSGIALKRLMQKTINHVEDLHELFRTPLQKLFHNIMALEGYQGDLPDIEYAGIEVEDIKDVVFKYGEAIKLNNSQDIKDRAVADILDIEIGQVKEFSRALTLREQLTQRINDVE